jgi:hypothetical protein
VNEGMNNNSIFTWKLMMIEGKRSDMKGRTKEISKNL